MRGFYQAATSLHSRGEKVSHICLSGQRVLSSHRLLATDQDETDTIRVLAQWRFAKSHTHLFEIQRSAYGVRRILSYQTADSTIEHQTQEM
jgi:hypothetical protein